jgi:hypothetical protein
MWKNMVQPDRPQMTKQYSVYALHARWLRLHPHTQNMWHLLFCMVARGMWPYFSVRFRCTLPGLLCRKVNRLTVHN